MMLNMDNFILLSAGDLVEVKGRFNCRYKHNMYEFYFYPRGSENWEVAFCLNNPDFEKIINATNYYLGFR